MHENPVSAYSIAEAKHLLRVKSTTGLVKCAKRHRIEIIGRGEARRYNAADVDRVATERADLYTAAEARRILGFRTIRIRTTKDLKHLGSGPRVYYPKSEIDKIAAELDTVGRTYVHSGSCRCKACGFTGPAPSWPRYVHNRRLSALCADCSGRAWLRKQLSAEAKIAGYPCHSRRPEQRRLNEYAARKKRNECPPSSPQQQIPNPNSQETKMRPKYFLSALLALTRLTAQVQSLPTVDAPTIYSYVKPPSLGAVYAIPFSCIFSVGNGTGPGCSGPFSPSQATFAELTFALPATWDGLGLWLFFTWGNAYGVSPGGNIQWNVVGQCADLSTFYSTPTYGAANQITVPVPAVNAASINYLLVPTTGCVTGKQNLLRVRLSNTLYSAGGPSTFNGPVLVSAFSLGIRQ